MRAVDLVALTIGAVALMRLLGGEPAGDPFERQAQAASADAQDRNVRFLSRPYDDAPERRSGPGLSGSLVR